VACANQNELNTNGSQVSVPCPPFTADRRKPVADAHCIRHACDPAYCQSNLLLLHDGMGHVVHVGIMACMFGLLRRRLPSCAPTAAAAAAAAAVQFFITLDKTDWLDKKNTIFGRVVGDTIYNLLRFNDVEVGAAAAWPWRGWRGGRGRRAAACHRVQRLPWGVSTPPSFPRVQTWHDCHGVGLQRSAFHAPGPTSCLGLLARRGRWMATTGRWSRLSSRRQRSCGTPSTTSFPASTRLP
jgi:hypothetical protein